MLPPLLRRLLPISLLVLTPCIVASQEASRRPDFVEPPEIRSENGRLVTELTVAPHTIQVDGKTVTTTLYNGLFAPPTLRVRPGDRLSLTLRNKSANNTNMHYHGTSVSPLSPGDNVYLRVAPQEDYKYEVDFPQDHPQGLFWYHPHWHGTTEFQIGGGLSGLLSVDDVLEPWPELKGITQRHIILRDIQIVDGKVPNPPDPGKPTLRTVNGLVNPTINIRPGEIQLWRVGNIGADIFYDLEIAGHKLYEIARDGIRRNQLVPYDHLMLPTSARSEFLVVGGPPGEYIFRTREIDMGPAGDPHPRTTLATLVSSGPPQTGAKMPTRFPSVPDLRSAETCCARTIDFSETPDGSQFCMNNTQTNMSIMNTRVRIGCVEEWTVNNCSAENHVFHHHQLQFQVIRRNGKDVPFTGWQDTVTVDYRAQDTQHPNRCKCDDQGNCTGCTCPTAEDPWGSVVIRISYANPIIAGKSIYHCHIGEHEDAGMMQTIEISKDAGRCEPGTPSSTNRLSMTPLARAVCTPLPATHKH